VHGSITKTGTAGANSFTWNGKIGGHQLGPGTYQLIATPSRGLPHTVKFRIARRIPPECVFYTNIGPFGPVISIGDRRHVSCAQAEHVVRDYIEDNERALVVDGFHIRYTGKGGYVAVRPSDHARFDWIEFAYV
jgi:hypothetical protein